MTSAPLEAIDDLPEWRAAVVTRLAGGLTNQVWLLEKDGRRAVLKIDSQARKLPLNTRTAEAAVQSMAAAAGLASRVLHADERVYLTAYIEGSVWDRDALLEKDNLQTLALALRRLHALPLTQRTFDAAAAARQYEQLIPVPYRQQARRCLDVIEQKALSDTLCCCHNDLVVENIVSTPELRFLDWEYACDNDPMFDLATLIEHHALEKSEADFLLQVYSDGDTPPWRSRLVAQRKLYLALYWLWLASRPGSSSRTLDRVAERLATSCS